MLLIKKEQLRVFETLSFSSFREKMLIHIPVNFEKQTKIVGKKGLINIIQNGFDNAKKYGLITGYEMCVYTDLTIMLGHGFDTDPLLDWANEILVSRNITDPLKRADDLYAKAIAFMEYITGRQLAIPETQFKRIIHFSFREFGWLMKDGIPRNMVTYLEQFWPEKYGSVSDQVNGLTAKAGYTANKYGFMSHVAVGYFTLLLFLLGHRFDTDPQYPWLTSVLNDPGLTGEEYRMDCLHVMVKGHLELLLPANDVKVN